MITRRSGSLELATDAVPRASRALERDGVARVRGAFGSDEVRELRDAIDAVFRWHDADARNLSRSAEMIEDFRYEMLNRSETVQRYVADRRILDVIEPLLAEDCHVIANTAWRNPGRDPSLANTN